MTTWTALLVQLCVLNLFTNINNNCMVNALLPPFSSVASATVARPTTAVISPNQQNDVSSTSLQEGVGRSNWNKQMLVKRVAVVGATGRTGRLVVQELLSRGADEVVAMVRSKSKAEAVFFDNEDGERVVEKENKLRIVECDLTQAKSVEMALQGIEATIWCATGFSQNNNNDEENNFLDRLLSMMGMTPKPSAATKQSIDLVGLPFVAKVLLEQQEQPLNANNNKNGGTLPKLVMCSSAGVTRPTWNEEKKQRLVGAADIPIVRLNPFGILDIKRQSEQALRESKVPYCIVRPAGLNDSWPAGSRPILSQGDVAVGRINRKDLATLLVDVLSEPEATGKTMEVVTLANYPKPASLTKLLQGLMLDEDVELLSDETVTATYLAMQQLLPGEEQDSAALAMGQTYEQYDRGETGRLGERGQEDALAAVPKPTNK